MKEHPKLISLPNSHHAEHLPASATQSDSTSSSIMNAEYVHDSAVNKHFQMETHLLKTPTTKINKCALSFILSPSSLAGLEISAPRHPVTTTSPLKRQRTESTATPVMHKSLCFSSGSEPPRQSSMGTTNGCTTNVKKGSKFCIIKGCIRRSKHAKLCWSHGGSVKCKVPYCSNRAKSKGACWSHGGGTTCLFEDCDTISVSRGFCWAHGGGKRCKVRSGASPGYERTQNYCTAHVKEKSARQQGDTKCYL